MSEQKIDLALIEQASNGDREAFDILVLKYQHKIMNVISRFVFDHQMVHDIAQETFVKAYKSLGSFRGDSAFYTWLYRIAVNTAKNYNLAEGRRPPSVDIDYSDAESTLSRVRLKEIASPEMQVLMDEMHDTVLDAVNELPEELRTSIILREMGGLSYDEIASVMQCPVGTVRSRIFRARATVDDKLKPMLD